MSIVSPAAVIKSRCQLTVKRLSTDNRVGMVNCPSCYRPRDAISHFRAFIYSSWINHDLQTITDAEVSVRSYGDLDTFL